MNKEIYEINAQKLQTIKKFRINSKKIKIWLIVENNRLISIMEVGEK